ncbi:MAG: ZIP family metal transporter [Tenericutes bacterium]|nr:ZIP family metal transporter [Mycoplasmatota bacterium]
MLNYILNLNPVVLAFLATLFTWSMTALGAGVVFFFKKINKNILDATLGFAGGVMIAASFWSLLSPAIEMSINLKMIPWLIVFIGFFSGGLLLFIGDKIFNHISKKKTIQKDSFKRSLMLIFSITLHNIPEGLAVGVAFGSINYNLEGATLTAAILLAFGIGLQNLPEGTAISVPLRREGFSRKNAFFYGQLSGIVEPISGIIGSILVLKVRLLLPFLLSFAAGAMIYVVVQELIPESQTNKRKDLMALFTLIGFSVMMILDVALG